MPEPTITKQEIDELAEKVSQYHQLLYSIPNLQIGAIERMIIDFHARLVDVWKERKSAERNANGNLHD